MYKADTYILLLMMDISQKEYESLLSERAEAYQNRFGQTIRLYGQPAFINWWRYEADKVNAAFLERIKLTEDGDYMLHLQNQRGDHFVHGKLAIRDQWVAFLKRLDRLAYNSALINLIYSQPKIKKS